MYKIYFKQAVQMLKQNMFISIITILGTALAIMMIMAIIVSEEIKTVSVSPEINRNRTYYINFEVKRDTVKGFIQSGSLGYETVKEYLYTMETPEYVSANSYHFDGQTTIVNLVGSKENINSHVRLVDASYWRILDFTFISGRPFTQEEFESGIANVVISQSTAKKLLGSEDPIGQTIEVGFKPYRIIGVVKDVSSVFKHAYAELWVTYTATSRCEKTGYTVMILAKDNKDFPAIYAEVRNAEKKFGINHSPQILYVRGPDNHRVFSMGLHGESEEEVREQVNIQNRKRVFILIILLLVPAINLSGLSFSRIKKRTSEIGARKAFGAKRYIILIQVLYENLITSLIGGFIGLTCSYIVVIEMKNWLLKVPAESSIPVETLISPVVFLTVFAACLVINLLSAGLPAYRASRMIIIN